jgi:TolB-like protein
VNFFADLVRRRVFRTAAVYAAVAWGLTEALTTVAEKLLFPDWVGMLIVIAFLVGFPVAMYLAWVFDITPEGVRRTQPGSMSGRVAITVSAVLLFGGTAGLFWLIYPGEPVRQDVLIVDPMEVDLPDDTIAVLPFVNATGDESAAYYADGIAETLLHQLSRSASLRVIARDSSFQLRDTRMDARTKAVRLNAGFLLDGSVQRAGDTIRIIARLIDGESGEYLWSESFDGVVGDIFEIQDRIATAVERELDPGGEDERQAIRRHTASVEAWDLYLQGQYQFNISTTASLDRAIGYFTQAISLDDNFALAYAARANAHAIRVGLMTGEGYEGTAFIRTDGIEHNLPEFVTAQIEGFHDAIGGDVDRALELRPDLAESHAAAGLLRFVTRDYALAEESLRRSLELNPNFAFAHHVLGLLLREIDQFSGSLQELRAARSLDALSYSLGLDVAFAEIYLGRFDEAYAIFESLIEQAPQRTTAHRELMLARIRLGDPVLAAETLLEAPDRSYYAMSGESLATVLSSLYGLYGDIEMLERLNEVIEEESVEQLPGLAPDSARAWARLVNDWFSVGFLEPNERLDVVDGLLAADVPAEIDWVLFAQVGMREAITLGQFDRAARYLELVDARLPDRERSLAFGWMENEIPHVDALYRALIQSASGDEDGARTSIMEALAWLDQLEADGWRSKILPAVRAKAFAILGDNDEAIRQLELYEQDPAATLVGIDGDPAFIGIADDSRFDSIITRIRERNAEVVDELEHLFEQRGHGTLSEMLSR